MGRTQVSDPEICLNQTTKVLELRTSYSETHVLIFAHDSCLVLLPLLEQLPRIYKSEGSYRRGRREEEHLRLLPTLPNIQNSTGPVSQLYLFKFRRDQKCMCAADKTVLVICAQDAGMIRYPYMRISSRGSDGGLQLCLFQPFPVKMQHKHGALSIENSIRSTCSSAMLGTGEQTILKIPWT